MWICSALRAIRRRCLLSCSDISIERASSESSLYHEKGTSMIRIGIVGVGFMGMIHYLAARNLKYARVEAICSRDEKKLAGDWRSIQGNFGPRGEIIDLSGIKKYRSLDELLGDRNID